MPNFEVLDARIASALNKIIHNSHFKRRISLEEQKAQKHDSFLRGRQIAYLIHECFQATGSHDSVETYADLFTIGLRNDDIQEFDSKWDWYRVSHTHSCGFISFQNTRKFCLNFVGYTTPTILHNFTGHRRSHWCFQLLTCVLDGFFEFRILGVDEIDSTQFSSIFKVYLFLRPLLLLLLLGVLSHWLPEFWP